MKRRPTESRCVWGKGNELGEEGRGTSSVVEGKKKMVELPWRETTLLATGISSQKKQRKEKKKRKGRGEKDGIHASQWGVPKKAVKINELGAMGPEIATKTS